MLYSLSRMNSSAASFDTLCVVSEQLRLFQASAETLMVSGTNDFSLR